MRRRILAPVLAVLVTLLLAGCVRFQADLTLQPDDTVDGSVVIAVVLGDDADAEAQAAESVARIEAQLLGGVSGAVGATRSEYEEDGYYGTRFIFDGTPITAFDGGGEDGSLSLTRDGDTFVFEGVLDFTPDDGQVLPDPDADTSNVTVRITFPGEVVQHNGELDGRTVSWATAPEARIEMSATGSAIASGPPAWVLVLVIVLVAVALLAVGVIAVLALRRGSDQRMRA